MNTTTHTYTYTYTTSSATTSTVTWYINWTPEPVIPRLEYDFVGQLEFEG